MMPLLGSHGKITAVAPGCRAVTGYIEQFPFIWSRDFGIIYLNAGAEYFGIGNFLSDDGQVMVGTLAADEREQTGFIWNYGGEVHFMYELNILRTTWGGCLRMEKLPLVIRIHQKPRGSCGMEHDSRNSGTISIPLLH